MVRVKITFTQTGDEDIEVKVENLEEQKKPEEWKQGKLKKKLPIQNLFKQLEQLAVKLESGKSRELLIEKWPPTDKSKWSLPTQTPAQAGQNQQGRQPSAPASQHRPAPVSTCTTASQRETPAQTPPATTQMGQDMLSLTPSQVKGLTPVESAHAPYNFVSLPPVALTMDTNPPGHEMWHSGTFSGTIHCELENITPIYTRDGRGQKDSDGNILPDFFHLDRNSGTVVIPPRSIKGMLRSVMEILSLAPMRPGKEFDSKQYTWRSVGEASFPRKFSSVKAGFLLEENGHLSIKPCQWVEVRHKKLECFDDWKQFLAERKGKLSVKPCANQSQEDRSPSIVRKLF